jgi:hypothetical protein
MSRLFFASEILRAAKEVVAIEFDTEEEMKKYKQEHAVRPETKMTVKKTEKSPTTQEQTPEKTTEQAPEKPAPSTPEKPVSTKHDFSSEGFYSQRPKLKDAVGKVKGILSELEKLEAEAGEKEKEGHELRNSANRAAEGILGKHSVAKYKDLPVDAQKEMDALWEPINKHLEIEHELGDKINRKKEEISQLMENTEEPEVTRHFSIKHGYRDTERIKESLDNLDLMHHGSELKKRYDALPPAKHEEVQAGDYLMRPGKLYQVEKKTPSGRLRITNLNSGERFIETPKSWNKSSGGYLPSSSDAEYRKIDSETAEYAKSLLEEMKRRKGTEATKEARITNRIAKELASREDTSEDIATDVVTRIFNGMAPSKAFQLIGYADLWKHTRASELPDDFDELPKNEQIKIMTKVIEKALKRQGEAFAEHDESWKKRWHQLNKQYSG